MPTYPIYHQNWDGGSGLYPPGYGDWNLAALGGTADSTFAVTGSAYVTSSPSSLDCSQSASGSTAFITKTSAESSADGKLSAYWTITSIDTMFIRVLARSQGNKLSFGDSIAAYILALDCPHTGNHVVTLYKDDSQGVTTALATFNAAGIFAISKTYICELTVSGNTQKGRVYNKTDNTWLQTNGTWGASAVDAITASDTSTPSPGRIGVGKLVQVVGKHLYFDDIFWDPPAPTLSLSSASLVSGGSTVTLTAGGFSDPISGVTWGSSNTGVATVSGGVVTPVAAGTATITATGVSNTSQTATASITVAASSTLSDGFMPRQSTPLAILEYKEGKRTRYKAIYQNYTIDL